MVNVLIVARPGREWEITHTKKMVVTNRFDPEHQGRDIMRRTGMQKLALGALVAATAFAVACGGPSVEIDDTRSEEEKSKQAAPLNSVVFLDAEGFQQKREAGAVVLDARKAEDYAAGHLDGAIHADEKELFKDDSGMISADPVTLQEAARGVGITEDDPVIIYGGERSSKTGRLFWSLEYLGHGEVYLYLDGYEKLIEELDEEPSTEASTAEGDFVVALRPEVYATAKEVQDAVNGDDSAVLIDTRRLAEYEGVEDRGDPRQGYIPDSVYYYWEDVFDDEGNLRPKEDLRQEFEQEGLWKDDVKIIPYCQTGTRSSTIYAVFRWLGHPNPKNYDGSWVEWSRDESLPVATVEEPTTEPEE